MCSRLLSSVVLIGLLAQFVGCGGTDGVGSDGLPTDPVASFNAFLEDEFERIKQSSPQSELSSDHSINVEKTDSLVSPLIGTSIVEIKFKSDFEDGEMLWRGKFNIKYAWQDGNWVCTVGSFEVLGFKVLRDDGEYKVLFDVGQKMRGRTVSFEGYGGLIGVLNEGF